MDVKKETVIKVYAQTLGNVTNTCAHCNMSRTTFYRWLEEDKEFKEAIDNTKPDDLIVDKAEAKLLEKISDGDTTAIIFTLKTKGKKRGYVERTEQKTYESKTLADFLSDEDSD